jgi:hypothetical protein
MTDELLSENDVLKLRQEVKMLKRQLGVQDHTSGHHGDVSELTGAIKSLNSIFSEAAQELKIDTHDAVLVAEKLDKILSRLEKVEIQNEKIAKGIVALADMLEEVKMNQRNQPSRMPQMSSRPVPGIPPPATPQGAKPLPSYNIPEQKQERKGMFNFK